MMDESKLTYIRNEAAEWARLLLKRDPRSWLILDTETTGLGQDAEVIQIAAICGDGDVLLNNVLVRPTVSIPPEATRIHHITNEMVEGAPSFEEILPTLRNATRDRLLVIYNARYDLRVLAQSARHCPTRLLLDYSGVACAMLRYAEFYGEWDDYHQSFRWQKLQGGDHSALGDCRATLALIHKMAGG